MSTVLAPPIGGFIGLEPTIDSGRTRHPHAIALSTGRAAFRSILETMRPTRVHVPDYVCHVLLQPLQSLNIPWRAYPVGCTLDARSGPTPRAGEMLFVVNYFGIRADFARSAAEALGDRVIIDNTQAFFEPCYEGAWVFNSARKFFGVPDGAYLYGPHTGSLPAARASHGIRHLELRSASRIAEARSAFLQHERALDDRLLKPTEISDRILSRIDYETVARRRRENFRMLDDALGPLNLLETKLHGDGVPHSYPLLPERPVDREALHKRRIFVPTFWPELLEGNATTTDLAARLLPLPIDQRYEKSDMTALAEVVRESIAN